MSKKLKLTVKGDTITIASESGTAVIKGKNISMRGDINSITDVINIEVESAYVGSGEDRDINITD